MSNPPPGRGKPSLIAAARAQGSAQAPAAQPNPSAAAPPTLASVPMSANNSSTTISSGSGTMSARSTPIPRAEGSAPPPGGIQKLKFKPKVPIRRVKQEVDVKPDISQSASPVPTVRGGLRGRGRGGPGRGRGRGTVVTSSIAAGVFGGPRPAAAASSSRRFGAAPIPAPRNFEDAYAEVYSDHSDEEGVSSGRPIDIDMVSTMSESAPTSLYRDRRLNQGKAKGEKGDRKGKKKAKSSDAMDVDGTPSGSGSASAPVQDGPFVKAEPISPEKQSRALREDDAMLSDDENQDRDERGRRVRSFAQTGGIEDPDDDEEVNEAHKVDLSESEEEEEEEDMEGDFVQTDGFDNPEEKLFIFQFPHLFPKFAPSEPIDLSQNAPDIKPDPSAPPAAPVGAASKDVKPDIKLTVAQLKPTAAAKKNQPEPQPEGRVGTMVVMKSGKVKMVMGKDIVMDVTPGLPATFIQHLVHLDHPSKSAHVLGEVHKNYVVTPDIDRLLQELYINGGKTHGEIDVERRRRLARDRGLIPMK